MLKKSLLVASCLVSLGFLSCTVTKTREEIRQSWTKKDSVAYFFGRLNGEGFLNSLKQLPDSTLDHKLILDGFSAGFNKDIQDSLSKDAIQSMMMSYFEDLRHKQEEGAKLKNEQALKENKKRDGVKVTESGLQYKVIRPSRGVKPMVQDTVVVHYKGKTIDGKEFDNSYKRNAPAVFSVLDVIPGWTEGLCLMNKGSKFEFYIPADLAYGARGSGGVIGPYATLIFEIELLDVKPYQEKDRENVIVLDKNSSESNNKK